MLLPYMIGRVIMQKKILLIEDDQEISELITSHLQEENYSVLSVFDGEIALRIFEKEAIDLVLLDIMLPKLNGMDFF